MIENIRTIGIVYAVIALIVFVGVLLFFWWICRAEDEEREQHTHDEYYWDEEEELGGAAVKLCFLLIATGCAILWVGIPVLIFGVWVYEELQERFPELMGGIVENTERTEEKE